MNMDEKNMNKFNENLAEIIGIMMGDAVFIRKKEAINFKLL